MTKDKFLNNKPMVPADPKPAEPAKKGKEEEDLVWTYHPTKGRIQVPRKKRGKK